ncbi:MAG: 5'-methylthioadenosine/adenosylhomocysteine nucleosidase [Oscillospiraceae bacterium]|nr:5'-methylthioadenosine/adenosylhomocysteine nucleosidase [Oscillospiraceae bacterium]
MTKLGIIGAMDVEVQTLKENIENLTVTEKAGTEYYEGTLLGMPVVVVKCGIGKVNAAIGAQILCDCFDVTAIVNTGIAGSLCAQQNIGDMVVSSDVWHHDFDCVAFGYPMCRIPGMPQSFAADEKLIALAQQAAEQTGSTVRIGRIASGDQFVADPQLKEQITQRTQALCTEMEGAAIAQTAYRNGVPFVILRCISDKADNSAEMDYPAFEAMAAQRCAKVAMSLAQALCQV